jgi:DNA-binding NarL/FixJ family response regulator
MGYQLKKKTVLLADKHPATLEGIRGLLETVFDSVVMVSDEMSLIETLSKLAPDLVVVDQSFKVTSESNVIILLNKHNPEVKIIALSTYEGSEFMEKCMSSGALGYVLKRSAARDLIKAVEEVLNGNTFAPSRCQ